jgi:protein-S-isoprenylcysteine O-methyltransferase Ste14
MQSHPPFMVAAGNLLFRYRNVLFPLVMVLLIVAFPPMPALGNPQADLALDIAGMLIALAGQTLRAAVIGFAYIKRGGVNRAVYADGLVTEGFFTLCRNPLYLGNLLVYAGLLVVYHNPWVYALGGGFFVFAYRAIVAAEETYLGAKFGAQYAAYWHNVPRWWPRWSSLHEVSAGLKFSWARVIVKDYSTACAWVLTLLILLSYQAVHRLGWDAAHGLLSAYSIAAIVVLTLTGAARAAKKSRWLRA